LGRLNPYIVLLICVAAYALAIAYLPMTGCLKGGDLVKTLTWLLAGLTVALVVAFMIHTRASMGSATSQRLTRVRTRGVTVPYRNPRGEVAYLGSEPRPTVVITRSAKAKTAMLVTAWFVFASWFTVLCLIEAFKNWWESLFIPAIFISPFIVRLFIRGFKVLAVYFIVASVFALSVGSWRGNPFGSGVVMFFALGIMPYILSRELPRILSQ